ncbi:hypothetical protein [Brachyspira hyodysenteriae]|uniref:hypothetical protein n=1 Tax=Brachyspira hyodysenteriae TaxID=159 RepID=UPI00063D89A7|nr:hypothetical protein [Brachyspira hyodysenteriae]KLI51466.1 hypothetical protein SZ43_10050 [Brachyspira hyodysenteriae]MCZ9938083.1 hypothetical protein [Brachyspira hyodysenteriae]MDA0053703.1 hypothetical protein [Brachyspira hyodysenteriae]
MKKFIYLVMIIFSLSTASLFSQNIGEPTGNAFLDYMHGRSLFGINFGPTLYAGLFDIGIGVLEPTFQETINNMTQGQANNYIDTKLKHYAFGLGFSYDFAPVDFMTVGLDIGFSVGEIKMDKYNISFTTVPWSLNVKFFFWRNAPFGFFLSPRFGGTALSISGSALKEGGLSDIYSHGGFYMSLELGWRIQLFPKIGANWPVQVGIDISLFDIGYYVAPWTSSLFEISHLSSFKQYEPFANIRALFLPRIGITLRF